jgi:acetyl esterase/lipase
MSTRTSIVFLLAVFCLVANAHAQKWNYPPELPDATVEVFKLIPDGDLKAYIYQPEDHQDSDRRGAIVFFFGGGWSSGTPEQFAPHCEYFAKRGLVAITCDYRVAKRQGVKPPSCVSDAKSAIRWVRENHEMLGVDPDKIIASGGSAGGHIAACTALLEGMDETEEDASISSKPNALALFNPVIKVEPGNNKAQKEKRLERFGVEPTTLSPYHNVREDLPPTIIFHGTDDTTVPIKAIIEFTESMQKAENRCELIQYEGQGHGFFNQGRNEDKYFTQTVRELDDFLVSLNLLAPIEEE